MRTIYKVIILLVQWSYGQMPENYTEYLPVWTNLHARINDRMDRIIEWLKWRKPEVAGDVEEEYNKLMEWGWGDKWKDGDRDDFDTGISMVRGCALGLYEKLQHLAELAEQEELEKSGARKQYQSKAVKEKIPLSDFQLFIDSLIEDFWNVKGFQPDISPDFIKILDYKVEHITQKFNNKDMEQILAELYGQFKSSVEHYNKLAQEGFQQIERIELLANANKMISFAIGPVVKHLETIISVLSKTADQGETQKLENDKLKTVHKAIIKALSDTLKEKKYTDITRDALVRRTGYAVGSGTPNTAYGELKKWGIFKQDGQDFTVDFQHYKENPPE